MKIKMIMFNFLFIFLFYLSLFVASFLPFVASIKAKFSQDVFLDYVKDILLHPIENIKQMHAAENPLLYVSTAAAFLLFAYLLYKSRNKNYENVGERYGVQGSSRWAKNAEIFKVPEQITIVPSKNMYAEIKKTLKNNEVKK